ncbi:MAG: hypothetical protein L6Q98_24860 [Anaerolineae bacterium]|nr:hypothetical protein [Anaerolineae bacterium]NUQ07084.1 hypothetical protein [Anaerolineae bacterium]
MTIQIVTAGRKDVDDFFKLSDVFTAAKLTHTPLLVFIAIEDAVQVRLLDHARDLLSLPDETPVMGQWRGTMRSDFFQFTVGQYRVYAEATLAPLKSATQVVKVVGPQGGVKRLNFEYIDEQGIHVSTSVIGKAEIERLTLFFYAEGIPVTVELSR